MRGVSQNSKFSQFKIFPKLGPGVGGSSNFQIFPNSKKSKTSWGGEGQQNYGLFPLFVTLFILHASLRLAKYPHCACYKGVHQVTAGVYWS